MFCCGNSFPNKVKWMAQFFGVCSNVKYTTLSRQIVTLLSSIDFNLNVWEGFTNDIKHDLAENKSWFKIVCMCRNIKMVIWWCVHKLACFMLEQIHRKLNTVNKNTLSSMLQILKLYTYLHFQKAFKTFLGCFIAWYEMFTITWKQLYFSWTIISIIFFIKFQFFAEKSIASVLKVPAAASSWLLFWTLMF